MINNRYKIIEQIGEGRSKVFACEDKFFPDEKIAIKILQYTANDSEIESFYKEYEIIKNLIHPNIISVFDKGTILKLDNEYKDKFKISENDKFMTLERVDGIPFEKCSELQDESKFKNIIKQISLVLQYIHQSNYIYFDLKHENILISNDDGEVRIKLIDFGLTRYVPSLEKDYLKGTAEYLAPEILKNENIDYRVDFYSLGILLYQLVYKKLPFRNGSELEIFRAHIEKEFEFPSSKFSPIIVKIIKKLLSKNPSRRYATSLEIIYDLGLDITLEEKINLSSSLTYLNRQDTSKKLLNFIENDSWGKICTLIGKRGSGKSRTLEQLAISSSKIVHIKINNFISSSNFWQQFFSRLLFNEKVFKSIDDSLIQYVSLHIDDNSEDLLIELKTILSKIASNSSFVLLIDDFDKFEAHNIELLLQLFPILLANQIKVILGISEESKMEFLDDFQEEIVTLKPFNDDEVSKLVKSSFYSEISHRDLENLILSFSEREPAAISNFISELIMLEIISFSNRFEIEYNDDKITSLLTSQYKIFEVISQKISSKEKKVLEVISLFQVEISNSLITEVLKADYNEVRIIVNSLRDKNILQSITQTRNANFINDGFKKYLYSNIKDVTEMHYKAGRIVLESFPDMNTLNKIRQFELAKRYDIANEIIDSNLNSSSIKNLPLLQRKLLYQKLSYDLKETEKIDLDLMLINLEIVLGNYNIALKLSKELEDNKLNEKQKNLKNEYIGIILIKTGKIKEGINILLKTVDLLTEEKNKVFLEIASAYLECNNYEQTDIICKEILKTEFDSSEIIGRAQNLLGISNLYNKSELELTLMYFEKAHETFTKVSNFIRIAGSEVNLGNIQNILGNYVKAEKHWNKALQLNQSIGNVEQEANVLLSTGVFNYEHSNYEKAIKVYKKAGNIFKGLGSKMNYGLININLGEVYLEICEYQKSLESLTQAEEIFVDLDNNDELIEVYFLLARLFIKVKNEPLIKDYFLKFDKLKNEKTNREEVIIRYTNIIAEISIGKIVELKNLNEIMEELYSINEKLIASEILFIAVNILLNNEKFEEALELLNRKTIVEISSFNNKYNAFRLYLMSKIPLQYQSDKSFTRNYLLLKSFTILKSNSISELTINVLNNLIGFFDERGNENKAKEYALFGRTILLYIFEENKNPLLISLLKNKYSNILQNFNRILN